MNVLFAALASQVGLDVRPVLVANQREVAIDLTTLPERYFIDDVVLGIKIGESWKAFTVSSRYLYPGMLDSDEQGMPAIVTDPKTAMLEASWTVPPTVAFVDCENAFRDTSSEQSRNAATKVFLHISTPFKSFGDLFFQLTEFLLRIISSG